MDNRCFYIVIVIVFNVNNYIKLQLSEAMMTAAKEDLIKLGLYSTKGGNKRT